MCFDKFSPTFVGRKSALTLLIGVRWGMEFHRRIRKLVLFLHKSKNAIKMNYRKILQKN